MTEPTIARKVLDVRLMSVAMAVAKHRGMEVDTVYCDLLGIVHTNAAMVEDNLPPGRVSEDIAWAYALGYVEAFHREAIFETQLSIDPVGQPRRPIPPGYRDQLGDDLAGSANTKGAV